MLSSSAEARLHVDPAITKPIPGQGDPRYVKTSPAELPDAGVPDAAPPTLTVHRVGVTVAEAMVEARRNNRVCPKPRRWHELFEMLPDQQASEPAAPLTGRHWNSTASITKRNCLREQLNWAAARGVLDEVLAFLQALPEEECHHMDD